MKNSQLNKIFNEKLNQFCVENKKENDKDKSTIHYKSIVNISKSLRKYNDEKAIILKEKLIEYFDKIKYQQYDRFDKLESLKLYKDYVAPSTFFLFKEEKFISHAHIKVMTLIGILIDIILYFLINDIINFFFPVFTISFFLISLSKKNEAKIKGKYAANFW